MTAPFVGEIRIFAGSFAPRGYAACDGQLLPISQNTALFSLLGITYGGNGTSNFQLPNLQNSVPIGAGDGPGLTPRVLGETAGSPSVTLLSTELPSHPHTLQGFAARSISPINTPAAGSPFGETVGSPLYAPLNAQKKVSMAPTILQTSGGTQPHNNTMPTATLFFIIALTGVFPPRN